MKCECPFGRGAKASRTFHFPSKTKRKEMSTKDAYDMRTRYSPRFLVPVGHETTVASKNTLVFSNYLWRGFLMPKLYDILEKSWFPNFGKIWRWMEECLFPLDTDLVSCSTGTKKINASASKHTYAAPFRSWGVNPTKP